ncbi:hypothetical protein [Sandaracinus amylolyticus]|uniref:hypothetical protein n=1 Tax=Sandaracinus amylolyticus TaxID=927083 RepID=UPI001F15E350|nr:hypothetical protein [Sandaracinus amylolyticus]
MTMALPARHERALFTAIAMPSGQAQPPLATISVRSRHLGALRAAIDVAFRHRAALRVRDRESLAGAFQQRRRRGSDAP